ncbi:MAG TPA: hypothetical protein VFD32_17700 [Dehalococcoidia bacterium]|nr:hypothetical protein [Dehalococcoidia bacterium]
MSVLISLLASAITFAFAGAVLWQYRRRRRTYQLVWAAALLCYGAATTAQFVAEAWGWSVEAFRVWYLAGGLLTAAYLGQGTAFLLLPRRAARASFVLLLLLSLVAAWRIFTVPLHIDEILPPAGRVSPRATSLPADLRADAALLNIYGTLLLVGGAIWSAVVYLDQRLDRRRRGGDRVVANLLIAGGALVIASAGSFEALGHGEFLYAGEILGIAIIFAGFLRSGRSHTVRAGPAPAQPAAGVHAQPLLATAPPGRTSVRSLRRMRDRETDPRRAGSA